MPVLSEFASGSKDIPAQILVFDDFAELFADIGGIEFDGFLFEIGAIERDVFKELFHDGVQATGADVFGVLVDLRGDFGDFDESIFGESELDAFGFEQRHVLLDERGFRFFEDANEIGFAERFEFDADGKAALQFGDEI